MAQIFVDGAQLGPLGQDLQQQAAQLDDGAGAVGRHVETAEQLLPRRLDRRPQASQRAIAGLALPVFDRLLQRQRIAGEIAGQHEQEFLERLAVHGADRHCEILGQGEPGRLAALRKQAAGQSAGIWRALRRAGGQLEDLAAAIGDGTDLIAPETTQHGECPMELVSAS